MKTRELIPVGGLLATTIAAGYMVVQLSAQSAPQPTTQPVDFTNAIKAQVKDAQGQLILEGTFMAPVEEDGGLERRATLAPAGGDTDASGEAEVEYATGTPAEQEIEFSVQNLTPDATFTFAIDGTDVATAKADRRGRVDVERKVRMPGAAGSR